MILNEDYFKDLDLTDDDIASSVDEFNSDDIYYDTPAEYYNAMTSRFTHSIIFSVDSNNSLTQSDDWTVKIPHIFKIILYMFNAYGIEYSQPTAVEQSAYWIFEDKFNNCNFIDFYSYKLITRCNSLAQFIQTPGGKLGRVDMVMFFNLPKATSYITACKFIGNIMRHLWKDGNHKSYISNIMIDNNNNISTEDYPVVDMGNPKTSLYKMDKSTIVPDGIVVSAISLFFPEKSYGMIFNELDNDTQLLLKLYQCFPDYE